MAPMMSDVSYNIMIMCIGVGLFFLSMWLGYSMSKPNQNDRVRRKGKKRVRRNIRRKTYIDSAMSAMSEAVSGAMSRAMSSVAPRSAVSTNSTYSTA